MCQKLNSIGRYLLPKQRKISVGLATRRVTRQVKPNFTCLPCEMGLVSLAVYKP